MAWPLLQVLLIAAAAAATIAAASSSATTPDGPAPWPEQFHAVLFTNLTNVSIASTGPPLRLHDLYYDWPRRRNLNLIRHQLSGDPLYDVEWNNGTTFYFDTATCRTLQVAVGVLTPGWLGGAAYLGRETTGGIDCHVWGKAGFIVYYEDALTRRPVRWNFLDVTGIQQFVMSFEVARWAWCWRTTDSGRRPRTASWTKRPARMAIMLLFRMVSSWTRPGYSATLLELLPHTDHD